MIEGDEGEVVMPDSTLRGETLLSKGYLNRPQTRLLPSRGGETASLPNISAPADKDRSSAKEQSTTFVEEARRESDCAKKTKQKSDSASQQSATSVVEARQITKAALSKHSTEHSVPSKQHSAEEPKPLSTSKKDGKKQQGTSRQQLASVTEENEQPSALPATEDTTPSFRPVTPQSFKPPPRHNSADIRSCKCVCHVCLQMSLHPLSCSSCPWSPAN